MAGAKRRRKSAYNCSSNLIGKDSEESDPQSSRRIKEDEDQAEDRKRKRNQEHENTDPFQVSESEYNLRIFEAVNPFVDVTVVPAGRYVTGLTKDKVGDGLRVEEEVLDAAYDQFFDIVYSTFRCFGHPKTELGGRPIHTAYLSALGNCTRQSSRSISAKAYYESESEREVDGGDAGDNDDDVEDIEVKAGGQLMVPTEGDDTELKTKCDFKVRVLDKRINKSVTVLVIQCGWETLSINKSFQAAGYAMKDAAKNMKLGRFEPIFLQAWGETAWRYGIVIPYGLVRIKNGELVNAYGPAQEKTNWLQKRLQQKTEQLALDYDISMYQDGEYVVGKTIIFQKKFPFWFCDLKWNNDTRFFIQSLLRIVVGDRILSWHLEDFEAVIEARI